MPRDPRSPCDRVPVNLARVGELMLGEGVIAGERVVSADWVRRIRAGGDPAAAAGTVFQRVHSAGSYANQWWITGSDRGDYYAVGIYGQFIWVDPPSRTVVAKFWSLPEPVTEQWNRLHAELFRDICRTGEQAQSAEPSAPDDAARAAAAARSTHFGVSP